jgi:hypothetical protein
MPSRTAETISTVLFFLLRSPFILFIYLFIFGIPNLDNQFIALKSNSYEKKL